MKTSVWQWLVGAACVAFWSGNLAAGERTVGTSKQFKGPVGLQLYSLRDSFKQDVPGTLDKVKAFGFKYVELAGTYGLDPAEFRKLLEERGLVAVAGHFGYEQYRDHLDEVLQTAKTLGLKYVGVAWIPHAGKLTVEDTLAAAKVFNAAGKAAAKEGMRFYYHDHGYEFQPYALGTLLDLLMQKTDPRYVSFQMDLLWTVYPGQDPVKLLRAYPNRWRLIHLKDLRKGVKGDLSGHTDVRNDVALGTGQMDFPAILKTAQEIGVRWYFIEDESPSAEEQIPQSLKFLEQVSW